MIKFRLYYDKDKEEEFLNNMVQKGYAMTHFFLGVYWFEPCKEGEYTYIIDIKRDKTVKEFNEYCDLIKETGGELIQTWGVWAIFRKKGEFELYSDNSSKIEQYKKIQKTFLLLALLEGIIILPTQIQIYIRNKMSSALYTSIVIGLFFIIFIIQVYKCSKKIMLLKYNSK